MLAAGFAGRIWTKDLSPATAAPVGPWTDVRAVAQRLAYPGSWANTEVKGHDQANSIRRAAGRRKAILSGRPSAGNPSTRRAGDDPGNLQSRRDRGRRIR